MKLWRDKLEYGGMPQSREFMINTGTDVCEYVKFSAVWIYGDLGLGGGMCSEGHSSWMSLN